LDLEPEVVELAGEFGAVRGADLAAVNEPRAGVDRHDLTVAADGAVEEDVGVQLRIGRLVGDRACGRVPPARRDHRRRLGVDDRVLVDALADHRHPLYRIPERPVDRGLVRPLDLGAQVRVGDGPDRADRLRG
jgi:hypothetical protein